MKNTIKITLDDVSFKTKPTAEDVQKIQTRLKRSTSVKEVTLEELINYSKIGEI